MNSGLVAYASSDEDGDDNDDQIPISVPIATQNASLQQRQTETTDQTEHGSTYGPLMGPTIPEDQGEGYITYNEPGVDISGMSEEDAVRLLTQASHPMSEMPPSPPGSPNPGANAKIKHFLELKAKNKHFNEDLASKSAFQNPGLLQTLMGRADIKDEAQYHCSVPRTIYNPDSFPAFGFKEALLQNQQSIRKDTEAKKKMQSAAGTRTINFEPGQSHKP